MTKPKPRKPKPRKPRGPSLPIPTLLAQIGFHLENTGGQIYVFTHHLRRGLEENIVDQYGDPPTSLDAPAQLYRYSWKSGNEAERAYPTLRDLIADYQRGSVWRRTRPRS